MHQGFLRSDSFRCPGYPEQEQRLPSPAEGVRGVRSWSLLVAVEQLGGR